MFNLPRRTLWRRTSTLLLSAALLLSSHVSAWAAVDPALEVRLLLENYHLSAPKASQLEGKSIPDMLAQLDDPHTQYFTAEELKQFENSLENNYVGIGVQISEDPAGIYIEDVFDGSPAQAGGVRTGDIIIRVGDQSVVGMGTRQVMQQILGPEDTQVNITILRLGQEHILELTRKQIHIPPVSSRWFTPGIGYMNVTTFSSDADELMKQQLDGLKNQGIGSLVVDLRNNGGGLLETAKHMAELFIENGILIHAKDRDDLEALEIKGGQRQPFPVYFLVNEYSASASEVLAGALQDYGLITLIGKQTYGKGSVQAVYNLTSGGALKVTEEEYLTPKLRKVNKVGLTPDKVVEGSLPQLLTALRMAGLTSVEVSLVRDNVSINGVRVNDWFPTVREEGRLYVPTRVLAAIIHGSVAWNEATSTVEVTDSNGKASYSPTGSDWLLREGTSLIDVNRFAEAFPEFSWSESGSTMTFRSTKE